MTIIMTSTIICDRAEDKHHDSRGSAWQTLWSVAIIMPNTTIHYDHNDKRHDKHHDSRRGSWGASWSAMIIRNTMICCDHHDKHHSRSRQTSSSMVTNTVMHGDDQVKRRDEDGNDHDERHDLRWSSWQTPCCMVMINTNTLIHGDPARVYIGFQI